MALCATLRERAPDVPVVFYSGMDGEETQDAGVCAGAAVYVPKPHLDNLIREAQRLLHAHDDDGARPAKPSADLRQ